MKGEQAWALEDYLEEHPSGCEVSFNAGWIACEKYLKRKEINSKISASMTGRVMEMNSRWSPDVTKKFIEAKELVLKGYNKQEACKMVGLSYDAYMRRQRMEIHGKDRIRR